MRMTESEGGLSALELRFSNWASDTTGGAGYAFEDGDILSLGAAITVYAGDERSPQEIFRGVITGLEADFPRGGAPEITVLAEDALQRLRLARRSKTYEDVSIADIANQIAQAAGIQASVDGFEDTPGFAETGGVYVQMNESDLAFLRRLLARYDGDLQIVGDELHIAPRRSVRRAELTLQLHAQLRAVRVLADLAQQTTEVTVSGWDVAQGEVINVSSSGVDLGPGHGEDGATVLRDTLGERTEHVGHLAAATQAEAQAIADSAFDQRARRFLVLEGTTEGNPQLRVGAHADIGGLGPRFSNSYYITRVCHRYDLVNGYETDFEGECGYWGR
ncbi:hypothetical protein GC175_17555 [bacterium]|nr:hypothetical protein [bacterium]